MDQNDETQVIPILDAEALAREQKILGMTYHVRSFHLPQNRIPVSGENIIFEVTGLRWRDYLPTGNSWEVEITYMGQTTARKELDLDHKELYLLLLRAAEEGARNANPSGEIASTIMKGFLHDD